MTYTMKWREPAVALFHRFFHQGRGGRTKLAVSSNFLVRGVVALTAFIITPITVRYLGNEGYGLMVVMSSVVGWLQFSALGIGIALQNPLTDARAQLDVQRQRELLNTALFTLLGIGGILMLAGLAAFRWIDWLKIFPPVTNRFVGEIPLALFVIFLGFVSSLVLGFITPIYAARQEQHLSTIPTLVAGVLSLIATLIAVRLNAGLAGVVMATIGVTMLVQWSFALWTLYFRHIPELRPSPGYCSWAAFQALFGRGVTFLLMQIFNVAFFQADGFIIAHFLSTDRVTPYSVAQKVFLQVGGLFAIVPGMLWAAYAHAKATGDIAWIQRSRRKMTRLFILFYGALSLGMIIAGPKLLTWWVGSAAAPGVVLIAAVACYFCAREWMSLHAMLLNGLDVLRPQLWVLGATAALVIGLAIIAVQRYGVVGLALGGCAGYCLISVWYLPYLADCSLRDLTIIPRVISAAGVEPNFGQSRSDVSGSK